MREALRTPSWSQLANPKGIPHSLRLTYLGVQKLARDTRPKRFLLALALEGRLPFRELDEFGDTDVGQSFFPRPLQLVLLPHLDRAGGGSHDEPREDSIMLRIGSFECDLFNRQNAPVEIGEHPRTCLMMPCSPVLNGNV